MLATMWDVFTMMAVTGLIGFFVCHGMWPKVQGDSDQGDGFR